MANEPSWEELFSSERQPNGATPAAPVPAPDDDPFAALFGALDTGPTAAVSAPLVYDLQQPGVQPQQGVQQPQQPGVQQPPQAAQPSEYFLAAPPSAAPVPSQHGNPTEAAPADPFAGLFGTPAPTPPTPAAPSPMPVAPAAVAPVPAAAQPAAGFPAAGPPADPFEALFAQPGAAAPPAPSAPAAPVAAGAPPFPPAPVAHTVPAAGVPLTRREMREREAIGTPTGPTAQSAPAAPVAPVAPAVSSAGVVDPFAAAPPAMPGYIPAPPPTPAPLPSLPVLAPLASTVSVPSRAAVAAGGGAADVFPFDFGDSGRAGGGSGGGSGGGYGGSGGGYDASGGIGGPTQPRKKRRLLWLKITLPIVIVLGLVGGGAAYAWLNYETQVRELLGWELPNDFEGTGNGEEVVVTIQSGDLGSDVANTLHDSGVTMTFDAFYELLLAQSENVNFLPGNYALQKEMSAQAALDALLDPANKITSKLLITEGTTLPSALEIISETTSIPLADVQAAAEDPTAYGLPATEVSLEGWLFPATYELDGSETAGDILQLLVDTMIQHLDDAGVAPENRHTVLTLASIIQREAGSNQDDFYKIARVFQNRLDQGINLQSDATVAYGTGNLHTVWTTDEERADASNLFNTYANPGLPIGPIGLPGDLAIDAALHPADGPWLFFVPINLATGETVFSETADEHEAAVEQLRAWCEASQENASYCE